MTLTTAYSQNRQIVVDKVNDNARVTQTHETPPDPLRKWLDDNCSKAAAVRKVASEVKKVIIKVQFEKEIKSEQYSTTDTPLSTHIQNNQDTDLETLGNIVDELRKVKEGGALRKWNPSIAARLRESGLVDTETVQAITQINLLIYRLGNMDFSHKRVYNGETFDDTWNRFQREQD